MSRVALPSGLYIRYPYVVYFRDCASDMLYIALLSGSYIRCVGRSGLSASGLRKGRAAGGRLDKALFCIRIWTMHVLRKEEGQFSRRS